MRKDLIFNVSFVLRKQELACNVKHQDAQLDFMLNVLEETIIAWKLKEEIIAEINYSKCFVKSIDHLRQLKKWRTEISKRLRKYKGFARSLINAWILTIDIN